MFCSWKHLVFASKLQLLDEIIRTTRRAVAPQYWLCQAAADAFSPWAVDVHSTAPSLARVLLS